MTAIAGRAFVAICAGAAVALVAVYLALGGSSYEPTAVADPCEPREWRDPEGIEALAEQFALSALDGAACELQVSRETLTLDALGSAEAREDLAAELGISDAEVEAAVRAGLVRAVDDAEAAGALPTVVAGPLRAAAANLPVDEAIAVIEDAQTLFGGGDLLGQLGELLP